jgi:hypothetical protein
MVKKLLVLLLALLPATMVLADNDKPVGFEGLPAAAKQFIETHFPEAKITLATVERGLWPTYDVIFTDGTKIEFTHSGEWTEIDCRHSFVPESVLPAGIAAFIREHHPDVKVQDVERDRLGYELNLTNRLEISFWANGKLRGYDD